MKRTLLLIAALAVAMEAGGLQLRAGAQDPPAAPQPKTPLVETYE
jgi:hypothetical protein